MHFGSLNILFLILQDVFNNSTNAVHRWEHLSKPQVNRKKNYQGKREEAAKSGETVSVGVQCSSKW